jgi:predicted ATPase
VIVSRVSLKNWRNFRTADIQLGARAFLVGPNASGKSNFLDVFRFMRDIAKPAGGLQFAVKQRGGLSKIRCLAAREHPDVEITITLSDYFGSENTWKYALSIKQEPRGNRLPYVNFEKVWQNDTLILERPKKEDKKDHALLTQTHLEQISANHKFRDISSFFETIKYLHIIPQIVRNPEGFSSASIVDDPYGRNFLDTVARTPFKTRHARLRKIESALRIAVPQLSSLTDIKDETGIPHLEAKYEHWRAQGARQREDQFSDGTLRLLGLLWSLLESDSLLLLEEPELSLHSGIIVQLASLMYRMQQQRKRQIIVSTHSADLLSDKGISGEEVILLNPNIEGTDLVQASTMRQISELLKQGFTPSEAILPFTQPKNVQQLSMELFK